MFQMNVLFKTLGKWQEQQQRTASRLETELKMTREQIDQMNKQVEAHSKEMKTRINEFEGRQEDRITNVMTGVNGIGAECKDMPQRVAGWSSCRGVVSLPGVVVQRNISFLELSDDFENNWNCFRTTWGKCP